MVEKILRIEGVIGDTMQQLTIFDALKEITSAREIKILPRQGIIKNQVSIMYKGFHVANARDYGNGFYEIRPRTEFFGKNELTIQMMTKTEIEDFCECSFVKYELAPNHRKTD